MKRWRITPNEPGAASFTVEAETPKQAAETALDRLHGHGGIIKEIPDEAGAEPEATHA